MKLLKKLDRYFEENEWYLVVIMPIALILYIGLVVAIMNHFGWPIGVITMMLTLIYCTYKIDQKY